MARVCGNCAWGLLFVVLMSGCSGLHWAGKSPFRTQLNLKPAPAPEVLTAPPKEARYNKPQYPDVAFRDMNNRFNRPLDGTNGIVRAQGASAPPGAMSPGMGSPSMGGGIR